MAVSAGADAPLRCRFGITARPSALTGKRARRLCPAPGSAGFPRARPSTSGSPAAPSHEIRAGVPQHLRALVRQLHAQLAFADGFLTHMLTRNIRIEEDLIDQLFNSSEKRLARTLLLLARYGEQEATHRTLPRVSQELLAEMVGTTRSRVNFFMNKFRKLGFIDYNGDGLKINNSLLSVVLRD